MSDINTLKRRLASIQVNFNPEKSTYKIMQNVIDNDLSYNEMLMELSKIKGSEKYPDELKKEYNSIIDDLKELYADEKKKADKKKQDQNTRELKDLIDSLEKRKTDVKKLEAIGNPKEELLEDEPLNGKEEKKEEIVEEAKEEKNDDIEVVEKPVMEPDDKNDSVSEEDSTDDLDNKDEKSKVHFFLLLGIAFVIILTVLVLFLY